MTRSENRRENDNYIQKFQKELERGVVHLTSFWCHLRGWWASQARVSRGAWPGNLFFPIAISVSSISGKANKVLGLIKRNLWNCPKQVKETAYTATVRPKLEYACAAWDPYLQKDINSLERVPRKAARFCTNGYHTTARAWLADIRTTEIIFRLTLLYKMSHGLLDIDVDFYLSRHNESRTRGSHNFKYTQYRETKNAYFYSYFPGTIREWNALPAAIVEADSLARFQSGLRDYLDSG